MCSREIRPNPDEGESLRGELSKPPVRAFLSYSRSSEGATQGITQDLKACGIAEVWWDKDLIGAQPWWDTILHQIRLADVVVCLLDGGIRDSVAVRREYQYALDLGKPLLPLLLTDDIQISTLPVELSGKQYVDCRPGNADRLDKLREAILHLPDPQPLPDPLPEPPAIPRKEIDFLTDRVNSLEPLSEVDQVLVVSELRYLAASSDAKQRQFAQESLETLHNRRELLHRLSQEIEELKSTFEPNSKAKGSKSGVISFLGVAVVLVAVAGVLFLGRPDTATDTSSRNITKYPPVEVTPPVPQLADVDNTDFTAGNQESTEADSSRTSSPEEAQTVLVVDEPSDTATAPKPASAAEIEQPIQPSKKPDPALPSTASSSDVEPRTTEAPVVAVTPEDRKSSSSETDSVKTALTSNFWQWSENKWIKTLLVFAEQEFAVCGYQRFTLEPPSRIGSSNEGHVVVKSLDRSIPDRPISGFSKTVKAGELSELLPNCVVQIDHFKTSGVSRFRVRIKGDS